MKILEAWGVYSYSAAFLGKRAVARDSVEAGILDITQDEIPPGAPAGPHRVPGTPGPSGSGPYPGG